MKTFIQTLIVSTAFLFGIVHAEPTVKEIYQTAQTDRAQALVMIDQVIAARPNSSKAHFIRAELLLSMNNKSQARAAFIRAEQLDPGFVYASADSVNRLRSKLDIKTASSFNNDTMVIVGLIVVFGILAIWLIVRRKQSPVQPYIPTNYMNRPITPFSPAPPNNTNNTQSGITPSQSAPTTGSNIMSNVATGVAVGAGAVAGAALANHLINGNKSSAAQTDAVDSTRYTPDSNFGVSDGWDSSDSGSSSGSDSSDW